MAVELRRADEVLALLPRRPVARLRVLDLERLARAELQHRLVAQRVHLAGRAVRGAHDLALHPRRVGGGEERADRGRRDGVDLRWMGVRRGRAAVARAVVDAAAQPVAAVAGQRLDRAARRELELDGARAVVEAAREVLEHLGLGPHAVALGDLPAQRRVLGVHAGAAGLRGVDVDLHEQAAERLLEAEVQRVAHRRRAAEGHLVRAGRARGAVRHADVLDLAGALHDVGVRPRGRDDEVLVDLEDDRLLVGRARRGHLRVAAGDGDRLGGRRGEPEAHVRARRARAVEADAEQLEQRDVQLVRHPVEPVDGHLGHPREQLDQRDAGIGDVVLRPLRAGAVDLEPRLGDEVLEAAVVELDLGQSHSASSAGMT